MSEEKLILNFDDIAVKRKFMSRAGALRGIWEVSMKPKRPTRSLDQNAYWWSAVVTPFCEWLNDEWGERVELEQAHEMLKQKILGTKTIEMDGQMITIPATSRKLNTAEFAEMIEKASNWLAEFTGIIVVSSDLYYETKGKS